MLLKLSRFFTLLAVFAPLLMTPMFAKQSLTFPLNGFFPFISLKAIFFRTVIQLALAFLLFHLVTLSDAKKTLSQIWMRLKHPLVSSVIVFALLATLTSLFAENPTQAFWSNFERGEGAFQLLHYVLFFLLVLFLFDEKKRFRKLLKMQVLVSCIMSAYALLQIEALLPLKNALGAIGGSGRISGTLGNPSYLAAYLIFTFAVLFYLYATSPTQRGKVWLIAIAIFELFVFVNTGTRGAYVAALVGFLIMMITAVIRLPNKRHKLSIATALFVVIILGSALTILHQSTDLLNDIPVFNRLFDVSGAVEGFQPRVWTWNSALSAIGERPIFGWGLENFPYGFDKYYDPNHWGIESFFDRTHNVFLEYAVSGGVVLLIAYLTVLGSAFMALKKYHAGSLKTVLIATLIMYMIQGFFLFDVLAIYIGLFTFLALIMITGQHEHPTPLLSEDASVEAGHLQLITGLVLLVAVIALFITTAAVPWKKNQMITEAYGYQYALNQSFDPETVRVYFNKWQATIDYKSVIGQEEAVNGALKFTIDVIETAIRNKVALPQNILRGIMDSALAWFQNDGPVLTGLRDTYLIGGALIRAGAAYGQKDYLEKGIGIYNAALEKAPTRIEFIVILMDIARATKNQEAFNTYRDAASKLRPDVDWPVYSE